MVCRLQINKQNEKLGRLGRIAIADIMMLNEITKKNKNDSVYEDDGQCDDDKFK